MPEKGPKPSICFVAHYAYGAMTGGDSGHIGGVERQTSLMARWFAARGYCVSMVTWDEGQEDGVEIDGVRVFKMCRRDAGLPGLRFFRPRWTSLNAAMRRADAEVYYQNCAEYVTGQVALWCCRHGRKFVYSVASDPDCDPVLPKMHSRRERVLYRYGLKHADEIIVQTQRQQKMLRSGFGRESVVLPMPCVGPANGDYSQRVFPNNNPHRVLWIGRMCKEKRPELLLDLAETCPDLTFDFVGPIGGDTNVCNVAERAAGLSNVIVHGPVQRNGVSVLYREASCLCCTSAYEGFPNTFLEAWSHGLPIVSTFDPDNLIVEKGLGIVAKDVSGLAVGIRTLLNSPERWEKASRVARQYYLDNHTVESAMARFKHLFDRTVHGFDNADV